MNSETNLSTSEYVREDSIESLEAMPSFGEHMKTYREAKLAGALPEGIRDEQDYQEYLQEQKARLQEQKIEKDAIKPFSETLRDIEGIRDPHDKDSAAFCLAWLHELYNQDLSHASYLDVEEQKQRRYSGIKVLNGIIDYLNGDEKEKSIRKYLAQQGEKASYGEGLVSLDELKSFSGTLRTDVLIIGDDMNRGRQVSDFPDVAGVDYEEDYYKDYLRMRDQGYSILDRDSREDYNNDAKVAIEEEESADSQITQKESNDNSPEWSNDTLSMTADNGEVAHDVNLVSGDDSIERNVQSENELFNEIKSIEDEHDRDYLVALTPMFVTEQTATFDEEAKQEKLRFRILRGIVTHFKGLIQRGAKRSDDAENLPVLGCLDELESQANREGDSELAGEVDSCKKTEYLRFVNYGNTVDREKDSDTLEINIDNDSSEGGKGKSFEFHNERISPHDDQDESVMLITKYWARQLYLEYSDEDYPFDRSECEFKLGLLYDINRNKRAAEARFDSMLNAYSDPKTKPETRLRLSKEIEWYENVMYQLAKRRQDYAEYQLQLSRGNEMINRIS